MTLRIPNQGESIALQLLVNKIATPRDLILKLYKNDKTPAEADTEASYTEADFSGYSAITLTGASWTATPGDPSQVAYAQQEFASDADQTAQTIYGYFMVQATTGLLVLAERFAAPIVIENNGDAIRITPQITGQDTQD